VKLIALQHAAGRALSACWLMAPWHRRHNGAAERATGAGWTWPAMLTARRIIATLLPLLDDTSMNRNLHSQSPAATARLRMGWGSSMPTGAEISISTKFAVLQVLPIAIPI